MQKLVVPLAVCGVVALTVTAAFSGNEQGDKSPMLSQLRAGQRVKLERALSGGYNVNILNDRYVKSYERADPKYVPPKIIDVGPDFIVVDIGRGFKQTISARAIDVITKRSDADEADVEKKIKDNPKE
jgi:hypothetical protein